MVFGLLFRGQNLQFAMLGMGIGDARLIEHTASVGQGEDIACGMAQHPHTMGALLLGEYRLLCNVRTIVEFH